jgi:hypothetical protein
MSIPDRPSDACAFNLALCECGDGNRYVLQALRPFSCGNDDFLELLSKRRRQNVNVRLDEIMICTSHFLLRCKV